MGSSAFIMLMAGRAAARADIRKGDGGRLASTAPVRSCYTVPTRGCR